MCDDQMSVLTSIYNDAIWNRKNNLRDEIIYLEVSTPYRSIRVDVVTDPVKAKEQNEFPERAITEPPKIRPIIDGYRTKYDYKIGCNYAKRLIYWCNFVGCHEGFSNKVDCNRHQRAHTQPDSLSQVKPKFNMRRSNDEVERINNKSQFHQCNICLMRFKRPDYLNNHMLRHNRDKRTYCSKCRKWFGVNANMKQHEKLCGKTNHAQNLVLCDICDRMFTTRANLNKHKLIHVNIKQHACGRPGCNASFSQLEALKSHNRSVHTKEKPFSCSFCSKKFSDRSNRNKCQLKHEKEEADHKVDEKLKSIHSYEQEYERKNQPTISSMFNQPQPEPATQIYEYSHWEL